MQTFLPFPSFRESARVLDDKRLGKQRSEARTILDQIRTCGGWYFHPAVQMWIGYESALELYSDIVIVEWEDRGHRNAMEFVSTTNNVELPAWFGDPSFHASHRSNLLRKNPEHYGQFGWCESPDLPYVWPGRVRC